MTGKPELTPATASRTRDLDTAHAELGAPSAEWLRKQILAGRIRARKIGRHWRMTEQDIEDALEAFASTTPPVAAPERPAGITAASQRRRAA